MKTIIATIAILAAAVGFGDSERQANQSWVLHKIDEIVGTNTVALVANATNDTLQAAKDYTDQHGGGGGTDTNAVADIANAAISTNATVAAIATDVTNLTLDVSGLVTDVQSHASQLSQLSQDLANETERATAAEEMKRDKTDLDYMVSPPSPGVPYIDPSMLPITSDDSAFSPDFSTFTVYEVSGAYMITGADGNSSFVVDSDGGLIFNPVPLKFNGAYRGLGTIIVHDILRPAVMTTLALTKDVNAALGEKADLATTLAGYGISDAYTKTQADGLFAKNGDVYSKIAADEIFAPQWMVSQLYYALKLPYETNAIPAAVIADAPWTTNVCVNGTMGAVTNGIAYVHVQGGGGIDGEVVTNIVRDLAYERVPEIAVRSNRWAQITDPGSPLPSAYSGAVTNWVGNDLVLIYTNAAAAGSFTLDSAATVRILVVGGGGGGGNRGGGGGAGGFVESNDFVLAQGTYAVTVGAGGAGGAARYAQGSDGGDSFIKSDEIDVARAVGGGGGGSQGYESSTMDRNYGRAGGSGGGSAKASATGGAGIAVQGHDGGVSALPAGSASSNCRHGGGGGAGAAGGNGTGGNGLQSDILGFEQYFAGGGAGGSESGAGGSSGGLGGGAASTGYLSEGVAGEDGLGGGGSGGGGNSNNRFLNGGRGGSGIVVVRFVKLPVRVDPYALTSDLDDATNAIWQVLGAVNALLESAINGGN